MKPLEGPYAAILKIFKHAENGLQAEESFRLVDMASPTNEDQAITLARRMVQSSHESVELVQVVKVVYSRG